MRRVLRARAAAIFAIAGCVAVMSLNGALSSARASASTMPSATKWVYGEQIKPERGWGVVARTARGVAVDDRWFTASDGTRIFILRFRKWAVAFHFHVGTNDPPGANAAVPADAQGVISVAEWRIGVLGGFNGGFMSSSGAGGIMADGYVAEPLQVGQPTIVIDGQGQLTIGTWGGKWPKKGDPIIAARQNLGYLVQNGRVTAMASVWYDWGATWEGASAVNRSAIGVDAQGDVLYAAGSPSLPIDLAQALAKAGAVRAMELDINPNWPIAGVARKALHSAGPFSIESPFGGHPASVYETGWPRDFFIAMAEPGSWKCNVVSAKPEPHRVLSERPKEIC
jgi:hypothetical protein